MNIISKWAMYWTKRQTVHVNGFHGLWNHYKKEGLGIEEYLTSIFLITPLTCLLFGRHGYLYIVGILCMPLIMFFIIPPINIQSLMFSAAPLIVLALIEPLFDRM